MDGLDTWLGRIPPILGMLQSGGETLNGGRS